MMVPALRCQYVIWFGTTPDKGLAFEDIAEFDRARERLDTARIGYNSAIIPILPAQQVQDEITRIINEQEASKNVK